MIAKRSYQLLNKINSLSDYKSLKIEQLPFLAEELRDLLVKTVAKNGGHLASNLGVVELTLALHYVYNSPQDKLIWDVGHQAYTHKILTGRRDQFKEIRKLNGLSGYLKRTESEHDIFGAGHVGTAVSAALGFAEARDFKKAKGDVVAIIGDGTLTNGVTFEGINNIGELNSNITIVLNDNKWSISKNIGGIAKYLARLSPIRIEGEPTTDIESIFHALGFKYFGPIDGHDINQLIDVFKLAKETDGPKLIHVVTKKGQGYEFSEMQPDKFHSITPFMWESGKVEKTSRRRTYTKIFTKTMMKLAEMDKKLIGITAAMPAGTGLDEFAKSFPERFYDVGIAESHAVIFAGALALEGFHPVVAIYSSFLQRAYDQIVHDIALQKIPVVFAVDRAGIVGEDGPTHHGCFDLSYLRNVPGITILAPKDENELQHMIYSAVKFGKGPVVVRYPRGEGFGVKIDREFKTIKIGEAEKLMNGSDVAILAFGSMVNFAEQAAIKLKEEGKTVLLYNARSAKPIDKKMVKEAAQVGLIITVEENILEGGFGSAILEELEKENLWANVERIGLSEFVEHGKMSELRIKLGLTAESIYDTAIKLLNKKKIAGV